MNAKTDKQLEPLKSGNIFNEHPVDRNGRLQRCQNGFSLQEATTKLETINRNRRLAETLMMILAIGEGRNIVSLVGFEKARNNKEAITAWVTKRQTELTELTYSEQVDALVRELRRTLVASMERFDLY